MRKIDNFVIGLIRYREGGGGNLSLGRHIFYKSVGSILNLEKKMILNHLYLSGNALEFWICGCRCILESSGSQNSGCAKICEFVHPLILRLLVLCAPDVLRPRALQDTPPPADPKF